MNPTARDGRRLGAVVVGTGFGCFTHVRALRGAGFDVLGVIGRDPAKTALRARQFDVPRAFTSLVDALTVPGVDAVTIATPPHTHATLALDAIAAGKNIICEKPFTRDAAEARTVLSAAEAAGVVHLLGTEFRWDPGQATLARAVAAGAIGDPRLVTVLLHVGVLADAAAEMPDWWAAADAGGGWLGAHGSQVIDQIRVALGEFDAVCASLPHVVDRTMTAEDAFIVQFRLRSGAVGVMQSTCSDWGPPILETRVTGSRGTVWVDGLGATTRVADAGGSRRLPVGEDLPTRPHESLPEGVLQTSYERMHGHGLDLAPYTCLAERFRDLILGHTVPDSPRAATFVDGVAGMTVLDAIRRSAMEGRGWVEIER